MGLDIYKLRVRHLSEQSKVHRHRWHELTVTEDDLKENKSLSDVFDKFEPMVIKSKMDCYDIASTAKKHCIPEDWYCIGMDMLSDAGYLKFVDEEATQTINVPLEDAVMVQCESFTLYAEEVGYQRGDVSGPMFAEFFGGGDEFFGMYYTPFNEVLDVAKMYSNDGTPMKSWVLAEDEFINFSF